MQQFSQVEAEERYLHSRDEDPGYPCQVAAHLVKDMKRAVRHLLPRLAAYFSAEEALGNCQVNEAEDWFWVADVRTALADQPGKLPIMQAHRVMKCKLN